MPTINYKKILIYLHLVLYAICITYFIYDDSKVILYNNKIFHAILNTVFISIFPVIISIQSAYAYVKYNYLTALYLGCSSFIFGLTSLIPVWMLNFSGSYNGAVTIHNIGILVSGILLFYSTYIGAPSDNKSLISRKISLTIAYSIMLIFMFCLTIASVNGKLPLFFIQGQGATPLRNLVLWTGIIFYFMSISMFYKQYRKNKQFYYFLNCVGLSMLTMGYLAYLFQVNMGSYLSWMGRLSQYTAMLYFMVGLKIVVSKSKVKGIPFAKSITFLFNSAYENHREIIKSISDAVLCCDDRGVIFLSNTSACKMYGYTDKELMGKNICDLLINPIPLEQTEKLNSSEDNSNSVLIENNATRKDGSVFPIEYSLTIQKIGMVHVITIILHDISARKFSLQATKKETELLEQKVLAGHIELKKAKDLTKQYLDLASTMFVVLSETQQIILANTKFFEVLECAEDDVIGKYWHEEFVAENYRSYIFNILDNIVDNENKSSVYYDIYMQTKKGKNKIIAWEISLVKDEFGKIIEFIASGNDITERKQVQREKQRLQEQLAYSDKLASIGALSSEVAHEINNPLAIIKGYINLIEQLVDHQQCETKIELVDLLKKQEQAVDRIAKIVNSLRNYTHIDREELEPICINQVISDSLLMCKTIYNNSNIELKSIIESDNLYSNASSGKLLQVIINILNNAKDAIEKKGIHGCIIIGVKLEDEIVKIKISDNGIGIPKQILQKIFDPFFTTKSSLKGTGLGLPISQEIISSFQGKLSCESTPNVGTSFLIELPLYKGEITRKEIKVNYEEALTLYGKALVVDDEEDIRKIIKHYIKDLGLQVTEASNGNDALEQIKVQKFDYIFTDIKMPGISGIKLIEEIEKLGITDVKIIIISGDTGLDKENSAKLNINIQDYPILHKPFSKNNLLEYLKSLKVNAHKIA